MVTDPRARPFIVTRQSELRKTAEDYTELIADIITQKGEARTKDIAQMMGISHVTASKTVARLQNEGYVQTQNHQPITLTKKGQELAAFSKRRHETLLQFLISLGVPEETAAIDVEGMEHYLSDTTLKVLENLIPINEE